MAPEIINTDDQVCSRCGIKGSEHERAYPSKTDFPSKESEGGTVFFSCWDNEEQNEFLDILQEAEANKAKEEAKGKP